MDIKSFFNIDEVIAELQETKIMRWKLVYFVIKICVLLVLLTIFISPKIAAIFMFALVAFISAVPATTAIVLRDTEMMDFFSVIIAISIGPVAGTIFAAVIFFISSFFSSLMEKPLCFVIGLPGLALPCLFVPWAYDFFGGNMYYTIYFYTFLRYLFRLIPACLFVPERIVMMLFFYLPILLTTAYITNTIHIALFGGLVTKALTEGLTLDLNLLVMIILIIAFFELAKISEKRIKKKKTPLDDKFEFFNTIKRTAKSLFFYPNKKTEQNLIKAKKDLLDYINILLKKLKPDDYRKLDIVGNQLIYLKNKTKQINDFTIKENIEQLNSIASLLPKIEVMSFREISGVYEISDRHHEFNDIYSRTKGTYKRPTEIIAKCRVYEKGKSKDVLSNGFSGMFSKTKQDDKNSVIIEIDVIRIIVNRDGEDIVGFEKIE